MLTERIKMHKLQCLGYMMTVRSTIEILLIQTYPASSGHEAVFV
jgi:hypothetical protein